MRPGPQRHGIDADLRDVIEQIERATAADPRLGETVGDRYRIMRLLAEGGMGRVYVGEHVELGLPVAIKLLPVDDGDETRVKRFRREAVAAAQLRSPHVVQVFDFGRTREGAFYLVMELLEGRDVSTLLAQDGLPGATRTLDMLRQVARALDHAHARGIVHRDLKPENVFVVEGSCYDDYVKVLDFGIAKSLLRGSGSLTDAGTVLGTPAYMAPEQAIADAERIGPASDRYALGALAMELLTGATPYPYEQPTRILRALVDEAPRMPSALGLRIDGLDAVFERALARDPGARFVSSSGFVESLASVLGDAPALALELPPGRRTSMIRSLSPRPRRVPSEAPTMVGRPTPTALEPDDEARAAPEVTEPDALASIPPTPARPSITQRVAVPPALSPEGHESPRAGAGMYAVLVAVGIAAFAAGWLVGLVAGVPG